MSYWPLSLCPKKEMTSNLKKMPIVRHKGVTFVPVTLCFSEREKLNDL